MSEQINPIACLISRYLPGNDGYRTCYWERPRSLAYKANPTFLCSYFREAKKKLALQSSLYGNYTKFLVKSAGIVLALPLKLYVENFVFRVPSLPTDNAVQAAGQKQPSRFIPYALGVCKAR
jgi:hypothetical protein